MTSEHFAEFLALYQIEHEERERADMDRRCMQNLEARRR